MKTKKYELDRDALSAQLAKKETINTVVEQGINILTAGKPIGPAMERFLKLLKILK